MFSSVCMYIFCQHTSSLQEYLSVHRSPKNARQHVVQLLQLVHLVCSQPPATSCWELQQLPSSDSTHFCFFVLYVFCNSCLFCCYCFRAVLRATIAFRWFWFHYFLLTLHWGEETRDVTVLSDITDSCRLASEVPRSRLTALSTSTRVGV